MDLNYAKKTLLPEIHSPAFTQKIMTGWQQVVEGTFWQGKNMFDQSTNTKNPHYPNTEKQQLAQAVVKLEREKNQPLAHTQNAYSTNTDPTSIRYKIGKNRFFRRSVQYKPENVRISYWTKKSQLFHLLMRRDAQQTFANIPSPQKMTINNVLTVQRLRFVGTKSMVSERNNWQTGMI